MAGNISRFDRPHVVIAGGSFAALEATLALKAMAGDLVSVTLVVPEPEFSYRPAATAEAFLDLPRCRYDLQAIAHDLGAHYHRSRVEAVASSKQRLRLASGERLSYDSLIVAIGARATATVSGALTFRDQRDVRLFRQVLQELEIGALRHVVFAVPSGCTHSLPIYELALLSAAHAESHGVDADVTIVSPESSPLAIFGAHASALIAEVLTQRGVRFVGNATASSVSRDGSLRLHHADAIKADRVVAVPQLRGQHLAGIPASWWGFVPTDEDCRVEGLANVYAAGDVASFPIKQGSLAAQQADRVARTIALSAAAETLPELPQQDVLFARLLGGPQPLFLKATLDRAGRPTTAELEWVEDEGAKPEAKVFGRYLTPYLESAQQFAVAS